MANTNPYVKANNPVNEDNTGRVLTYSYQAPTYASTIAIESPTYLTVVKIALTGALTLTADVTNNFGIGSKMDFLFSEDNHSGGRVVTFGTGFTSTGTLTVAQAKYGKASAIFDGASWIVNSTATA